MSIKAWFLYSSGQLNIFTELSNDMIQNKAQQGRGKWKKGEEK